MKKEIKEIQYLERIVAGTESKRYSALYNLALDLKENNNGNSLDFLINYIIKNFKYERPTISESMTAAKTLLEYKIQKIKAKELEKEKEQGLELTTIEAKSFVDLFLKNF